MPPTHDVMVQGHGLAGAAFAYECRRRGLRVAVVGAARPGEASRAAAGVVNPVVVRRLLPSWRAHTLLPIAEEHYRRAGTRAWHPLPLHTVLPNAAVAAAWAARQPDADLAPFVSPGRHAVPGVHAPHGTARVHACARLNVHAHLDALEARLRAEGHWVPADRHAVQHSGGSFHAGVCSAPLLVRCTGAFDTLPGLVPVKGETLELRIPGLALDHLVHRHVFVLPLGDDRYRVGATFKWDDVWEGPTEEGRRWLLEKAAALLGAGAMARAEVIGHRAGVRPTARDRRPIMGRIAPQEAVLNGLGARGVLLAPWCARHLAAHLFDGAPLDPEVDLARTGGT
ncbi:MAG: FAD-binding oxidoreductase [Flavobacteriales bacterium]|jgi:glycine/D-amino acid oxidase-like deaminating enzyme|nr:FAD-binding oxidoreductase [Flavobacteriales bacterium]